MQKVGKAKPQPGEHINHASPRKIVLYLCGLSAAFSLAFCTAFTAINTYYARQSLIAQEQIAWN